MSKACSRLRFWFSAFVCSRSSTGVEDVQAYYDQPKSLTGLLHVVVSNGHLLTFIEAAQPVNVLSLLTSLLLQSPRTS